MGHDEDAAALRGRRVLVTGARGFIGGALCRALATAGADVHASSRSSPPGEVPPENRAGESGASESGGGLRWWRCDLADPDDAEALIRAAAPDLVFHMSAAVTGARDLSAVLPTFRDGLSSTVNLLTSAARSGVGRVVLAGSVEARAEGGTPRSPYAAAKAAAAEYGHMFGALFDLPCVDVRISMTYGPGQADPRKLVPYVIHEVRSGRSPKLGSGTRLADWTYIGDTTAALLAAATSPDAAGRSIEIGTGTLTSVREVVERITALVDPTVQPSFGAVGDRPLEDEAPVDPSDAHRLLGGWTAKVTLGEGLRRTVAATLEPAHAPSS